VTVQLPAPLPEPEDQPAIEALMKAALAAFDRNATGVIYPTEVIKTAAALTTFLEIAEQSGWTYGQWREAIGNLRMKVGK
jgi:hypothetical protein